MIEVSLALGITAVGVLGAVAILPIALKTTNDTTYSTYLSDAANMVFMGIDNYLNEECYFIDYADEHKAGITMEKLAEIYKKRRTEFADIFETNKGGAINLNKNLSFSSSSGTGVRVKHWICGGSDSNHGIIAFYTTNDLLPDNDPASKFGSIDYKDALVVENSDGVSEQIDYGNPVFVVRYRIVVTNLENDALYKMDGLREFHEVETPTTIRIDTDPLTGNTIEREVAGARVAGPFRLEYGSNDEEKEANKLMKRVYLEFSWPASATYAARSKKTFVKEVYMVD